MVRHSKDDILKTEEETDNLINSCKNDKEKLVIVGLLYTGMRVSEFVNLRKEWIDWEKDIIRIPEQQGTWTPKTKASVRTIPIINDELRRILKKWYFKRDGIKISRIGVYKMVRRISKRVLKRGLYPHALRATYASILAEKNVSPATLQTVMGWATLQTAENYIKARRATEEIREKFRTI